MVEVQRAVELLAPQGKRIVLEKAEELHQTGYDGRVRPIRAERSLHFLVYRRDCVYATSLRPFPQAIDAHGGHSRQLFCRPIVTPAITAMTS